MEEATLHKVVLTMCETQLAALERDYANMVDRADLAERRLQALREACTYKTMYVEELLTDRETPRALRDWAAGVQSALTETVEPAPQPDWDPFGEDYQIPATVIRDRETESGLAPQPGEAGKSGETYRGLQARLEQATKQVARHERALRVAVDLARRQSPAYANMLIDALNGDQADGARGAVEGGGDGG